MIIYNEEICIGNLQQPPTRAKKELENNHDKKALKHIQKLNEI